MSDKDGVADRGRRRFMRRSMAVGGAALGGGTLATGGARAGGSDAPEKRELRVGFIPRPTAPRW